VALDPADLPSRFDAAVIGERERAFSNALFAEAQRNGAAVAVTAGARPTAVYPAGREPAVQAVVPAATTAARDDLGAGDVFAAAFFVALREGMPAALRVTSVGAAAIAHRTDIEATLG
jgi:sugar/nucleoside kinase (ribokinase family)